MPLNWDHPSGRQVSVTYSDIQGGYAGLGNIKAKPRFVDVDNGILSLRPLSPSIDQGNPSDSEALFDERDLDGTIRGSLTGTRKENLGLTWGRLNST
jgi:hypothetical protein